MAKAPGDIESSVRRLVESGDIEAAVGAALTGYGDKIYGYLMSSSRDPDVASEVYQQFSIDLWRGLPRFEWRSSLQTWAFVLARRALSRHLRGPLGRRPLRLDTEAEHAIAARWTRTATAQWRKTHAKDWLWTAIGELEAADRELLTLRLVQRMPWKEIALVLADPADDDPKDTAKAAALRKRFQRIKAKLKSLGPPLGR
jgi:RNA polymerase sigma-70 factor (ECF subfamily)